MAIRIELNFRLPNSPGALARVCQLMADERINVLALSLETSGHLRLVVDNHVHGAGVLREHHYQVVERDAIVVNVPHAPGAAAVVAGLLADTGANVDYVYGGGSEGGSTATMVFGVEDAQRAAAAAGL